MLFFNQNRNHDLDKEAQWGSKDCYENTFDCNMYISTYKSYFLYLIKNFMGDFQGIVAKYLKKTWQINFPCTYLHNFSEFDAFFSRFFSVYIQTF